MNSAAQLGVLVQMRMRQWLNRLNTRKRAAKKNQDLETDRSEGRSGTAHRPSSSWLRTLLFVGLFLFQSFYIARLNLEQLPAGFVQITQLRPLILLLSGLLLCGLFSFRSQELVGLEDESAWLLALPVSSYFIGALKILEHSLFNSFAWVMGLGFFAAALDLLGYAFWQIALLTPVLTLLLNVQIALIYYPLLLCFRRFLAGPLLQNIQALFTLGSMLAMVGLLSYNRFMAFFEPVENWKLPLTELLEAALAQGSWLRALLSYALLVVVAGLGVKVTAVGGLEAARRLSGRSLQSRKELWEPWLQRWPAMLYRDVILLLRDRNLSMKILLLPVLVLGMQFVLAYDVLGSALADPRRWTLLSLALGTYSLQSGAINILNHEHKMLWQWFALPTPLSRLLIQKACFWGGITLSYALITWSLGLLWVGLQWEQLWLALWLLTAVALQALNAVSLGVIGLDPYASLGQPRLSTEARSMFLLGSALLAFSLYAPGLQPKWVTFLIYGTYSLALWQKALVRLPLLLDSSTEPERSLDLSDSLSAVLLFFFIQLLVGLSGIWLDFDPMTVSFWSFTGAGLFVVPSTVLALRSQGVALKTLGWWRLEIPLWRALLWVVGAAGLALLGARLYLGLLLSNGELPTTAGIALPLPLLLLLSVCIAPVVEEILFRGMLQQSLSSLLGFQRAWIFTSLLFALMHPGISALPVFGLALASGWVFQRTGHLAFAIAVHALYNLGVLLIQV